jgi:hypothetical protein
MIQQTVSVDQIIFYRSKIGLQRYYQIHPSSINKNQRRLVVGRWSSRGCQIEHGDMAFTNYLGSFIWNQDILKGVAQGTTKWMDFFLLVMLTTIGIIGILVGIKCSHIM